MSYINSALRKVQEERDSRYAPYGEIISSPRGRMNRTRRRVLFGGVIVAAVCLVAVIIFAPYKGAKKTVKAPVYSPRAVAVLPVAPAKPKGADDERLAQAARHYEEALAAQRSRRWEEAGNLYKQALASDPRHANSLNNLGVLYMSQGRFEEATELFFKAIAAKEDYVDPYYNLACLYAQTGNYRAGLAYMEKAVKIDGRVRQWAKNDADLKRMRLLPEFKKITEE